MDNKIANLIKQNEAIYNSLKLKNIEGLDELIIEPDFEQLIAQNLKLKELSKAHKPVQEPVKKQQIVVENKKPKEKEDDEDVEPVVNFSTITNMEEIKRAFFSGDYELFNNLVTSHEFKLFYVKYKYESDNDGKPDYIAKNLIKGFIRNFDDLRKYFMICFRCFNNNTIPVSYSYPSLWIVNSNDSLNTLIGSLYEDFEFTEVIDKNKFFTEIVKLNEDTNGLLAEGYVH